MNPHGANVPRQNRWWRSDLLFLLTSVIWGFAFVAQRIGMDNLGPFIFTGIRFALGGMCLIPFVIGPRPRQTKKSTGSPASTQFPLAGGCLAGLVLFLGVSCQQVGIIWTTAGKAGFITGLYVVMVPVFGIVRGQKTSFGTWMGGVVSMIGLSLLSVGGSFSLAPGDALVLVGAVFWAVHVQVIAVYSRRANPLKLAFVQFWVCSLLSLSVSLIMERSTLAGIYAATLPLLYGGLLSVGVAYTLQVVAQREAHPAHAAIILSLESVFAAVGGWILLGEVLSLKGLVGCGLMLAGMVSSQLSDLTQSGELRRPPVAAASHVDP
jgi:drug/metabolite transporter (DMT)-like permease